jgi:Domain of unknown function (DUF4252)
MYKGILIAAAVLLTQTARAQGYFDFGQIPGVSANPTVQVDLNPTMLGFVTAAASAADPAVADIVAGIENVRVRVYNLVDDPSDLFAFIDDTSGELERDGWQRTVFVDDDEAKVRVYLKFDGVNATGITVMVAGDDHEAVFINVAGVINPTQLGLLAQKYGEQAGLSGVDLDAALENAPADAN